MTSMTKTKKTSKKFKVTVVRTTEYEVDLEEELTELEASYVFLEENIYNHLENGTVINEEILEVEII